jgi:ribosomal protein L11 methyltransferase
MPWLRLTLTALESRAGALSDALLEQGALSVDVLDADADTPQEQAIFGEPDEPPQHLWSHNLVTALFSADAPVDEIVRAAARAVGFAEPPAYHIETLEDCDWVRLTQSQFDPIKISQRLWIVPTWHTAADPAAINISLDPGLAFGTGSHPTTRLCLRWLDAHLAAGAAMLDYGCGSGILAIAAAKLGAGSVTGVDVDAQAVQASRDNARANQVEAQFCLPDDAPRQQYDIVVANILTNPLKLLAPLLANATRAGGQIVLSGILSEQAEDVMKTYAQWFNLAPIITDEGWACVSGVRL